MAGAVPGSKRHRGELGLGRQAPAAQPSLASPCAHSRLGATQSGISAPLHAVSSGVLPPAYPGLRAGAPGRQAYQRGCCPDLNDPAARDTALEEHDNAIYAPGTLATQASLLNTIRKLLNFWEVPLLPLTVRTVRLLGASLKAGRYRSAAQYLSAAKQAAERADQTLSPSILSALRDARRSCTRGLGPAHKAEGLPFARLHELPDDPNPWAQGGPRAPKRALIAGSWWMTRETELANARAALVAFAGDQSQLVAAWCLSVSKAGQEALG